MVRQVLRAHIIELATAAPGVSIEELTSQISSGLGLLLVRSMSTRDGLMSTCGGLPPVFLSVEFHDDHVSVCNFFTMGEDPDQYRRFHYDDPHLLDHLDNLDKLL